MPSPSQQESRSVFTFVEEATHLLRRAPLVAWLAYFAGSAPFVVFLFYFWSDMSRSPLASRHLLELSLLLALLYVWMKTWQAVFCGHLMALVEGRDTMPRLPFRAWLRLIGSQALVHATMPWLLTLSFVAMIPFAWAYAFYHNVTILAVGHFGEGGRTKPLLAKALAQAHYQPKPNHYLIVLITIFAVMVYLNFFLLFVLGTMLLKSTTGMENPFTRSPGLYLSSALHDLLFSLSYLVVNPFVKALYVLRCFYSAARKSGADIEVSLRAISPVKMAPLMLVMCFCGAALSPSAHAAAPATRAALTEKATPGSLPEKELDQSIRDVLQGSEFQWRLPRESGGKEPDSWLGSMLRSIGKWFNDLLDSIGRLIGSIIDWFTGGDKDASASHHQSSSAWLAALPKVVAGLAIVLIVMLAWMLWKNWKLARQTVAVEAEALPPPVNLESENVLASQLPENEWLLLAREKMEAGELRLALRALFLATLAHLGEKRLLQIGRSKSNGDYVRELGWRARGRDQLSEGFAQQVRTFDRVWYGWHDVSHELMARFQEQHERITTHAT
jgi:hypothetical protein